MTQSKTQQARFTLRARITLLTAGVVAATIVLTSLGVFFTLKSQLYDQFEDDLVNRAQAAVGGSLGNPNQIAVLPADAFGTSQWALLSPSQGVFVPRGGSEPPLGPAENDVANGSLSYSVRSAEVNGDSVRVVAVPAGSGVALVLADTTDSVEDNLRTLGAVILLVGAIGVMIAAVAGYAVARAGLRPVGELTDATERVTRTGELRVIPVRSDDELGRLAQSFNIMLTSLDAARERERELVADAGHELRTPLTSIRTNLDLLAQSQDIQVGLPDAEREALLNDVRAQLTELSLLIDDLVQLSKGPTSTQVTDVDFAELVQRSVERVRPRRQGVEFEISLTPWWVVGDSALLERAVTNLLDNAVKWSPPEGSVAVNLSDGVLTVADHGPGIPKGDERRVFERFYRADAARSQPGSGLGLAIVAQTVEQHGGTVSAGNAAHGGAVLTMALPGRRTQPAANP